MKNVKTLLTEAQFIAQILSTLLEFGKTLFKRHKGDPEAAKADIRRIPDYWADYDELKANIDAEMEKLSRAGK